MPNLFFNQFILDINHDRINQDFLILRFSRDKGYLSYRNLAFLDRLLAEPGQGMLSVCFDWGNEAFALYERKVPGASGHELIRQLELEDDLRVEPIYSESIRWEHKLFQLFLNACAGSENPRYRYNNLTGKLYITSPNSKFFNPKGQSRVALEARVLPRHVISLDTVTFTALSRYDDLAKNDWGKECPKRKKKLHDIEKYIFDPRHSTFRRCFEEEKVKAADKYVRMRPPRRFRKGKLKNRIDFFSLNPKVYPHTKIALLNELLFDAFYPRFGAYFTLEQKLITDGFNSVQFKPADESFSGLAEAPARLIDNVGDPVKLKEIRTILRQEYGLQPRLTKKIKPGCLNLQFNHDAEYYGLDRAEKDPYLESTLDCAVQNFTLQQYLENGKNQLFKTLQEGHIKYDISQRRLTIFDWKRLQMDRDWYFAIAEKPEEEMIFHFLAISPQGGLTFSTLTRDLFNQPFHELMAEVFTGANARKARITDGVIFDGGGNINVIEQTELRTYPDLHNVHHYIMNGVTLDGATLQCAELRNFVREFMAGHGTTKQIAKLWKYLSEQGEAAAINVIEVKDRLKGKNKQHLLFAELFKQRFGYWLKHPFKNKEQVDKAFAALVDIHTVEEEQGILFWANRDMGKSKGMFATSNVVRRLKGWKNSRLLFNRLLDTMAVDFVRVDAPSVIPFPFKMLREYQRMASRPEGGIDFGEFDFEV